MKRKNEFTGRTTFRKGELFLVTYKGILAPRRNTGGKAMIILKAMAHVFHIHAHWSKVFSR